MFKSWRWAGCFGFPVEINLSFLLLLALVFVAFGGLTGVLVVGLTFGSVLLHELGHALVARRLGVHVSGIELSFFGGAAKMVQMPRSADHEIAIRRGGAGGLVDSGGAGLGLGMLLYIPLPVGRWGCSARSAGSTSCSRVQLDPGAADGRCAGILRALLTRKMDYRARRPMYRSRSRAWSPSDSPILGLLGKPTSCSCSRRSLWMMGTARANPALY